MEWQDDPYYRTTPPAPPAPPQYPAYAPAHATSAWSEYQPVPPLPPGVADNPHPKRRRRIIIAVCALALLVGGGITAAVIKQQNASAGFNNPDTLAADLKTNIQDRANDKSSDHYAPGLIVVGVDCIAMSQPHQFSCIATMLHDGQTGTSTAIATVSADGSSYITQ
jgi:hypothetical protein